MSVRRREQPLRIAGQRGQALIETAFSLLVFLALLLGLVDLARGVLLYNSVSTAAREGARFGAVLTDPAWATYYGKSPFLVDGNKPATYTASGYVGTNTIVGAVANRTAALDPAQTTVEVAYGVTIYHDPLQVTVTHPFTPIVAFILGQGSIQVKASSEMRFE